MKYKIMRKSIKIPVKILDTKIDYPKYAYSGDAGFDLCSCMNTSVLPHERKLIKCGFAIEIPKDYAGLVIPRSGLAIKNGVTVLNSPGLIDSGYRGEICVILYNSDNDNEFNINVGDRIAQMIIISCNQIDFIATDQLDESERSCRGFGSSGTK